MGENEIKAEMWERHWQETNSPGWNIGYPSTPIKEYIDQLKNKELKILIPGCGNAYEAEYLFRQGFKNTFVVDISATALKRFQKRFPDFPKENCFNGNFFEHRGQYDIIFEQTFFCAIIPDLREDYVKQCYQCLNPNGKIVGLLFDAELNTEHPPYGGNKEIYTKFFSPYFKTKIMGPAYNSIQPRIGRELFIKLNRR